MLSLDTPSNLHKILPVAAADCGPAQVGARECAVAQQGEPRCRLCCLRNPRPVLTRAHHATPCQALESTLDSARSTGQAAIESLRAETRELRSQLLDAEKVCGHAVSHAFSLLLRGHLTQVWRDCLPRHALKLLFKCRSSRRSCQPRKQLQRQALTAPTD